MYIHIYITVLIKYKKKKLHFYKSCACLEKFFPFIFLAFVF